MIKPNSKLMRQLTGGSLHDETVAHYIRLDQWSKRHGMTLKQVKIAKNTILSICILAFAWVSVNNGADPNLTFTLAIGIVALLNGVDLAELWAVWGEVQKAKAELNQENKEK